MRTPIVVLAGTLLVACASGTRVVYVPVPASTSAPAPTPAPPARIIPAPMPPVGVAIVRVDERQMLVSTNQPAYLAVFEIVPNHGVTLVYPASPAQRQFALTGSSWLNVSWRSARGLMDDDARDAYGRRRGAPAVHHVYVLASERPLRLSASAFDDRALATMLGPHLTRAEDPYETMAALSRRFVPPGRDEDWGEDVYTMDVARPVVTVRVAKIYCPDGSVVYARDEMVDRTVCPWQSQGRAAPAPRPDSVVASNGRRMPSPMEPGGVARIFRIPGPAQTPDTRPANGGNVADNRPGNGNGNGGRDGNDPKGNNGNHYGWGNGTNANNGNNGNANGGKDDNNAGGNVANGGSTGASDGKDKGNNGNHYGQEKNNGNNGNNGNGQAEVQQQGKAERPAPAQPAEPKPAEPKPAEAKPAPPRADPAAKDQPKPQPEKPDAKPEPTPENKGMRGVMDRIRAKADSADAKDKNGKPDHD